MFTTDKLRTLFGNHCYPQSRIEEGALECLTAAIKWLSLEATWIHFTPTQQPEVVTWPSQSKKELGNAVPPCAPNRGELVRLMNNTNGVQGGGQDIRILGRIIAVLMTFQSSEVNAVSTFRKSLCSRKYIHKCDSVIFFSWKWLEIMPTYFNSQCY